MTDGPDEERESADDAGDLWSAAFDPAANLRVLGEIQRRGLRAAGEIVERLIANVDGPPAPGDQRGAATREGPSATDLGAGVDLWVEMAKRSLDVVARLATVASQGRSRSAAPPTVVAVDVDVEGVGAQETIELRAQRTGPDDTTEVWLHNGTQGARHDLRLHCGELRSADGGVLPAGLAFDPEVIAELPARSSRGVIVGVGVGPWEGSAEPGTYRGIVMVTGLADVWLPVTVVVEP